MFWDALEKRRKDLFSQGVGTCPKQADPLTPEDEDIFWKMGLFSLTTATGLSNAVYFYNEKTFGFRARDEHEKLMAEQFKIGYELDGRLAKNISANLNTKATPRQVKQYADKENPRCVVNLFEKYLSLKPAVGRFYRRPLPVRDGKVVFSAQPVGVNKLAMYLPELFKAAGISDGRNITGHSGKVTCYTQLYSAGFDEQSIMKRSGYRSSAV